MTITRPTTLYNPHLLSRDELIAGFIAREPLLETLVDDLRRGGGQHHLLIGARGTGKTTLLLRLGLAIDDDPVLAKKAIALRFPEEQYNIIRLSDLWLNCLDALVDALERRGAADEAKRLDAVIASLEELNDEDDRAARALEQLTTWARRDKKLVVLLVDNLDLVLDRLSESHWALRKILAADKRLALVGASSSEVPETFEYGQAFYDFFNVHQLVGLDDDEARRVLLRLSEVLGTPQVAKAIADSPGRLKSLLLLSGGTPRTLQLLHGVLAQGGTTSAERDIEVMLDQVTPYYKARFEDLPAQAQQIFDAVALHWHPMTAIECADKTRLEVTLVSAQLTRLARQGVIAKVPHASGKLAFQIAERFFGIWYMMRASRRMRRKLFWLAVCVQELYGQEELDRRASEMLGVTDGTATATDPAKLLAFAEVSQDPAMKRRLERRAITMIVQAGERAVEWQGLDLDGEDRDLKDHAERARMLKQLHDIISHHIVPPTGMTAAQCADAFVGSPQVTFLVKAAVIVGLAGVEPPARQLIVKRDSAARFVHDTVGQKAWPADLERAIRDGEVEAFPDARNAADVDDILARAGVARRRVLGWLAGFAADEASRYAFSRSEDIDMSAAVFVSMISFARRDWPRAEARLRAALASQPHHGDVLPWDAPVAWAHAAAANRAGEAADLLQEFNLHERALPLYEALRAYAAGQSGDLIHLAPEVRAPTEHYLAAFHAAANARAQAEAARDEPPRSAPPAATPAPRPRRARSQPSPATTPRRPKRRPA